jgi:TrmH family RNA methyltransferase
VRDALAHGHPLEALYIEAGTDLRLDLTDCGAAVHTLEAGALARVTDTVTPQGVVAIAPMPQSDGDVVDTVMRSRGIVLVLAGLSDPGNAGTLLRVAESAGIGAVIFCDEAVDPFSPKCVRASAGSIFHVPVMSGARSVDLLEAIGRTGGRRLGAAARRGDPYDQTDLRGPLALVLGSEAHGVAGELDGVVDGWTHVPMAGQTESLNVAVTGAVLAFEAARQRREESA